MANNKDYVLWGSSGHAKVLSEIIKSQGGSVIALFDNNYQANTCLEGVPIYHGNEGFEDWIIEQKRPDLISAAVAIGGNRGKDRQIIASKFETSGLNINTLVHSSAVISESVKIGRASQVLANSVVSSGVLIGQSCILNNSTNVDHECQIGDGVHIAPGAILCGCVVVGDNSMIGAGAIILPRLEIGRGSVVGAGAVVTHNVPSNVVIVGNPARIIRK
jgi:sugar O-acyltransferase (sialic acid O-acetyltransferase NeuD family)